MRDRLLKFHVDTKTYESVQASGCDKVHFISKSDDLPIKKMDFIVFTDNKGNEQLRNFWELSGNTIHYTSDMLNGCKDFTLAVVLTNLYECIMQLRHGTYTEKKQIHHEVQLITLCLELLDEHISITQFIEELCYLTAEDENYWFKSSAVILKQYAWCIKPNEQVQKSIEKIRLAVSEINGCLNNKKDWHNIHRLAYSVHNEPAAIYRSICDSMV